MTETKLNQFHETSRGGFKDRISDSMRREGKYWTPKRWVNQAHSCLDSNYPDWEKEFTVFDPCCGGGNLTRGRKISRLIQTTLVSEDLLVCDNKDTLTLHLRDTLDFLNSWELPPLIDKELKDCSKEGRAVLFLMNPPYASPGKTTVRLETTKTGICETQTRVLMAGLPGTRNLYLQFMFKCLQIAEQYSLEFVIGVFSPMTYLTRASMRNWREFWFARTQFIDGFVFSADEFEFVKTKWMIGFCLFEDGFDERGRAGKETVFKVDALENERGRISKICEKFLYGPDESMLHWLGGHMRYENHKDAPAMTTGIRFHPEKVGKIPAGSLAFFSYNGFFLQEKDNTYLVSGASGSGRGLAVTEDNFWRAVLSYVSVRLPARSWLNEKDEFSTPNMGDVPYSLLVNALVFMIFNKGNHASSITKHWELGDRICKVFNHFFWMSEEESRSRWPDLKYEFNLEGVTVINKPYRRTVLGDLPHAASMLQPEFLWDEAKQLLEITERLCNYIYKMRVLGHPAFQYQNWDAGFMQLRGMWLPLPLYKHEFIPVRRALSRKILRGMKELGLYRDPGVVIE